MRIAVLYTGAVRTIEHTIDTFRKHVLRNDDVHVFATLQSDTIPEHTEFLQTKLGPHLRSLTWFHPSDPYWIHTRERLLDSFTIRNLDESYWKSYLRSSGSMIEYYQLYLSYLELVKAESRESVTYDYIVRIRPDVILTKPLDFSWLHLSDEAIQSRLDRIQASQNPYIYLSLFMNSLLDESRIDADFVSNEYALHTDDIQLPTLVSPPSVWRNYISNGRYILTLRNNVVYIVKRSLAGLIPSLGMMYGTFPIPDDNYWFNAENQFRMACVHSQISIFNSTTRLEHDSLYSYDPTRYFDPDGTIRCGDCLFFLLRKG